MAHSLLNDSDNWRFMLISNLNLSLASTYCSKFSLMKSKLSLKIQQVTRTIASPHIKLLSKIFEYNIYPCKLKNNCFNWCHHTKYSSQSTWNEKISKYRDTAEELFVAFFKCVYLSFPSSFLLLQLSQKCFQWASKRSILLFNFLKKASFYPLNPPFYPLCMSIK